LDDITLNTGNLKDLQKFIGTNKRILQSHRMQNQYCCHTPIANIPIEIIKGSQIATRKIHEDKFNQGRKIPLMGLVPNVFIQELICRLLGKAPLRSNSYDLRPVYMEHSQRGPLVYVF
jgi:hypothetical protein